jgi:hypothetical protein
MTTSNNPGAVRRADAPNTLAVAEVQPDRVTVRRGCETNAFYKTTEFIVLIVATIRETRHRKVRGPDFYLAPSEIWSPN